MVQWQNLSLLHNLLGVLANQHHWRLADSPACLFCRPPAAAETVLHFFTSCTRTSAAWHFLLFRATVSLGRTLTDETLLFLAWPPSAGRVDAAVVLAVITFTSWAWTTRTSPDVLVPHDLQLRLRRAAEGGPLYSILWTKVAGLAASTFSPASTFYLLFMFVRYHPPPLLHPKRVKRALPEDLFSKFNF